MRCWRLAHFYPFVWREELVDGVDVGHCGDGCVGGDGGDCDKSMQKHTCHRLKSLLSLSLQFNY